MKLSKILKKESDWCQNENAILNNGETLPMLVPFYSASNNNQSFNKKFKNISKWSLQGAISYFYSQEVNMHKRRQIMDDLRRAIISYTGREMSVAGFNNASSTSFEDIQSVIKILETSRR